jgi:hypothetical protein
LLPPTKLYFASPVHRAAGAGSPAGSRGVKSNDVAVDMDISLPFIFVENADYPAFPGG